MILSNKIAIIYGGSGAIGSAIARAFHEAGATIFLVARNANKLERVAADNRQGHQTASIRKHWMCWMKRQCMNRLLKWFRKPAASIFQ